MSKNSFPKKIDISENRINLQTYNNFQLFALPMQKITVFPWLISNVCIVLECPNCGELRQLVQELQRKYEELERKYGELERKYKMELFLRVKAELERDAAEGLQFLDADNSIYCLSFLKISYIPTETKPNYMIRIQIFRTKLIFPSFKETK